MDTQPADAVVTPRLAPDTPTASTGRPRRRKRQALQASDLVVEEPRPLTLKRLDMLEAAREIWWRVGHDEGEKTYARMKDDLFRGDHGIPAGLDFLVPQHTAREGLALRRLPLSRRPVEGVPKPSADQDS